MIFMSHENPFGDVLGWAIGEPQGVQDIGVGCQGGEVPVRVARVAGELAEDECPAAPRGAFMLVAGCDGAQVIVDEVEDTQGGVLG